MADIKLAGGDALVTPKSDHHDGSDFGDFLTSEIDLVEMEHYWDSWRGYDPKETIYPSYPVSVGEIIGERYRVEHSVGKKGPSSIWMAHDMQDKKDVALKIICDGPRANMEIEKQDMIRGLFPDSPEFVTYLRIFQVSTGGRQYQVLVLPLKGPHVDFFTLEQMPLASRMAAANDLLVALEKLHNAGIVHYNLHAHNCMWGMKDTHNLPRTEKYSKLGRPQKIRLPLDKGIPKAGDMVQPMEIPEALRTEDFFLTDFAYATKVGDPSSEPSEPGVRYLPLHHYCSPERLHGQVPSFACDMWSYMVLFATLYCGHEFWDPINHGSVLSKHVWFFGPLPEEWKGLYRQNDALDEWYIPDTSHLLGKPLEPRKSMMKRLEWYHRDHPEEDPKALELVRTIMMKVFRYNPEERLTATQLLNDKDFQALMERYGC
ncbi:kinase domain-containing protein [Aspergillus crustosus]